MTQDSFPCKIVSWNSYFELIETLANKISASKYNPDVLVNVVSSGRVISLALNEYLHVKHLIGLNTSKKGISGQPNNEIRINTNNNIDFSGKKVLVIDDITLKGCTISAASNYLYNKNIASLKTSVLYNKQGSEFNPDFFGALNNRDWLIFPWAYLDDIKNLVIRIRNETNNVYEIKEQLLTRYNLNLSEQEVKMFYARTDDFLFENRYY